jgi:hypothetical protein
MILVGGAQLICRRPVNRAAKPSAQRIVHNMPGHCWQSRVIIRSPKVDAARILPSLSERIAKKCRP